MPESDLAEIYRYETKAFNRQVKNNIDRFPEEFRFQPTKTEAENCPRCKIFTLVYSSKHNKRETSIKYSPYSFTEQGFNMLMTVHKSDLAVRQSMALIRLFKQMKDYIVAEKVRSTEGHGKLH